MRKVVAAGRDAYDEDATLAEYRAFMRRARLAHLPGSDAAVEPSLMVDLMWHTHMQFPARYRRDCVRMAGGFVDHIDEC